MRAFYLAGRHSDVYLALFKKGGGYRAALDHDDLAALKELSEVAFEEQSDEQLRYENTFIGEVVNSTNNKWLLISLSPDSFGWVIGDQTYVTVQQETVDLSTYLIWQKTWKLPSPS